MLRCPAGVAVPAPLAQNRAMLVWSAVRVLLVAAPIAFTSFKAAAYLLLVSAGTLCGVNCDALCIAKGVTSGQLGNSAAANAGGVGIQSPGWFPGVYGPMIEAPSLARSASICSATSLPSATPNSSGRPSGIAARSA